MGIHCQIWLRSSPTCLWHHRLLKFALLHGGWGCREQAAEVAWGRQGFRSGLLEVAQGKYYVGWNCLVTMTESMWFKNKGNLLALTEELRVISDSKS